MVSRSHILIWGMVIVMAGWIGAAQAQPGPQASGQTPPSGTGSPTGSPTSVPRDNTLGNPGAVPQEQQMDPYAGDKDFVKNLSESNATEVQLGKLAQEKASNEVMKELGKRMVEAHTQISQQLKQAAAALNVQVPTEPPRKAKKAEEKLAKLSGTDFDRAYAKMATDEQKRAVKQFEREAKNGKVPGIKDFAAKNLPAEQERQKQAEGLASAGSGTAGQQK